MGRDTPTPLPHDVVSPPAGEQPALDQAEGWDITQKPAEFFLLEAKRMEEIMRKGERELEVMDRKRLPGAGGLGRGMDLKAILKSSTSTSAQDPERGERERVVTEAKESVALLQAVSAEVETGKTGRAIEYLRDDIARKAAESSKAFNAVEQAPADEKETYELHSALITNAQELYATAHGKNLPTAPDLEVGLRAYRAALEKTPYSGLLKNQEDARKAHTIAQGVLDHLQGRESR